MVLPFSASDPPDSKAGLHYGALEASPLTWGRSSPGQEQLRGCVKAWGGGVHPLSRPCLPLLSLYPSNLAGRGPREDSVP